MNQIDKGRLDDRLAAAQTPREAAIVLALHAEDQARMGHADAAREALERARRALGGRTDVSANSTILIAEAHLQLLRDPVAARLTLARASAIARAADVDDPCAYAQAWLAQIDEDRFDVGASLQSLGLAFAHLRESNLRAKARIAVVVAFWRFHAGDAAGALAWLESARRLAASESDTVMNSAVMAHNATVRVGQLRLQELMQPAAGPSLAQAEMTVQSSLNFDRVLDAETLSWCGPLLLADVKVRQGAFGEALALYRAHLDSGASGINVAAFESTVHAEVAWCLHHLGRSAEVVPALREAEATMHLTPQLDERVVMLGRMATLYDAAGLPAKAEQHRRQREVEMAALLALRERIESELGALLARHGVGGPWPLPQRAQEPTAGYAA